jgi:hypothetical protein
MNTSISSYLNGLILEYGRRSIDGFSLDVSDIEAKEKESLIFYLLNNDPGMKETVVDYINFLINERIPLFNAEYNYSQGLWPEHDSQTGEVIWMRA